MRKLLRSFFFLALIPATAQATVYYADGTRTDNTGAGTGWATAKKDIQAAISLAGSGDQVWVKAGIYYPTAYPTGLSGTTTRDYTFSLKNNLAVYGGFAGTETALSQRVPGNTTTLSGDIGVVGNSADNCYHVVSSLSNDNTAILDGFVIRDGKANGSGTVGLFDRQNGAGMDIETSSPTINNCFFTANSTSNAGGAIYLYTSAARINSCVFTANTDNFRGAVLSVATVSGLSVTNATFYNNTGASGGAIYNYSGSGAVIKNCIIWGTGATAQGVQGTATVTYSTVQTSVSGTGNISINPMFTNSADPDGADNLWGTADDGLRLQSCSAAINSGNVPTPAIPTDIAGNARVGAYDMGAYEFQGAAADGLATGSNSVTNTQSGYTTYGDCGNLITIVQSGGSSPVSGSVTAKVYIQGSAGSYGGQPYLRRYYDVRPVTNPNTATATLTLFFSQADFDDYNANRGSYPSLPIDAADAAGNKANLRISQQHGTSSTGAPGTYTGWTGSGAASVLITPASVTYNTTLNRWEVTFSVTGFSGFFVNTSTGIPLPLTLEQFTAQRADASRNQLAWTTATETPGTVFGIERSSDGSTFSNIGIVIGKGQGGDYNFYDEHPLAGTTYYRLHLTEGSGAESFSNTAIVARSQTGNGAVTIAPVPARHTVRISITDASLIGSEATVSDMQGHQVYHTTLTDGENIDISNWAIGIYCLRLPTGEVLRIVKQ